MASTQEMDVAIKVLEDKVDFLMKAIRIGQPSPIIGMPPRVSSLLDLYQESKLAGLTIADEVKEGEVVASAKSV